MLLRYQVLPDQSLKKYDSDKQGIEKRTEDVDKKIPSVTGLVTTTAVNTKVTEIAKLPSIRVLQRLKIKYQTLLILSILQFNRVTKISFNARMKEVEKTPASKIEVDYALLESFDLSYVLGKRYFKDDGVQNNLVF